MKLDDLSKLCDLLRRKGVTEFEGVVDEIGTLKLRLGVSEEEPATPQSAADAVKKEYAKMLTPKPRGRDGLTAEDQEELYGGVVDVFPEDPENKAG